MAMTYNLFPNFFFSFHLLSQDRNFLDIQVRLREEDVE